MARAQVDGAGMACSLADENTVTMDWTLCNAVGGVKLMVALEDLDRARAVLAEKHAPEPGAEAMDAMPERSAREDMAQSAWRAAVLGCLFSPVSLYALWLALRTVTGDGPLGAKGKRQLSLAFILIIPPLVIAGTIAYIILSVPHGPFPVLE